MKLNPVFDDLNNPLEQPEVWSNHFKTERIEHPIKEKPQNWNNDIAELENYFSSIELPTQPIKFNNYSTIHDCKLFIEMCDTLFSTYLSRF